MVTEYRAGCFGTVYWVPSTGYLSTRYLGTRYPVTRYRLPGTGYRVPVVTVTGSQVLGTGY